MPESLNFRQQRFVEAYTTPGSNAYGNGAAAARAAGYSTGGSASGRRQAWRLLQKPAIKRAIEGENPQYGGETADKGGHLYVLKAEGLRRYKIGYAAADLDATLEEEAACSPIVLEEVATAKVDSLAKAWLEAYFADERYNACWFDLLPADLAFIKSGQWKAHLDEPAPEIRQETKS